MQRFDRLTWKWNGEGIDSAELGDPVGGGSSYSLCLYDHTAGNASLASTTIFATGTTCNDQPCWEARSRGLIYDERDGATRAAAKLVLKTGRGGKLSIIADLKGERMPLTPFSATELFDQDVKIT